MTVFITGTGTGVGKTTFAVVLAKTLVSRRLRIAAVKPVSSGDRADARHLQAASQSGLPLSLTNPWYFQAPMAPLFAARLEGKRVLLRDVSGHLQRLAGRFDVLLVEGAGGLLSPLGEDHDNRDLIRALRAIPVIVAANRLGVLNDVLLTWNALPRASRRSGQIVLMGPAEDTVITVSNRYFLEKTLGPGRVLAMPFPRDSTFGCSGVLARWADRLVS